MSRFATLAALLAVSCFQNEWNGPCDSQYDWRTDRGRDLGPTTEIQLRLEDLAWDIQEPTAHDWIQDIEALHVTLKSHPRLHTVVAEGSSEFCPDVEVVPAVASISAVGLPLQLEHDTTADRAWRRGRTGPWNRTDVSTLIHDAEGTRVVLYVLPGTPDGMPTYVRDSVPVTFPTGDWSDPVLEVSTVLNPGGGRLGLRAISFRDDGPIFRNGLGGTDIGRIEGWPPPP